MHKKRYLTRCGSGKVAGFSKRGHLWSLRPAATLCDRYRASLRFMLALLVSHRAKLWASIATHPCVCGHWWSVHLCIDSHLCRCIVQRLCVAVFMRPCITTLCDRYRASLRVYERSVGFASLRNFRSSFYKASAPYPHGACSPPHQKAGL